MFYIHYDVGKRIKMNLTYLVKVLKPRKEKKGIEARG